MMEVKSIKGKEKLEEDDTSKDEDANFQKVIKALATFITKTLIKEMFKQSPCCVNFLQDIKKATTKQ